MIHEERPPRPELARYVQIVWGVKGERPDEPFPRTRIMPDGIVELVLHQADPFVTWRADGSRQEQPRAFAISQMREHIAIESSGAVGFVAARFQPWGAHHFFTMPIRDFLDDTVDATRLWPGRVAPLLESLAAAPDLNTRIDRLQDFLCERRRTIAGDDSVDDAVRWLREVGGRMSIGELCKRSGFSPGQLERKFVAAIGTTPKVFARMSRFLHVCHRMSTYRHRTLAALCQDCGYYDQSHFIREFRAFSGLTPTQFFGRDDVVYAGPVAGQASGEREC